MMIEVQRLLQPVMYTDGDPHQFIFFALLFSLPIIWEQE